MLTSRDFKELLNLSKKHKVRYLVAGDYAVMKYTEPRFTRDLDLWISTDEENSKAVFAALKEPIHRLDLIPGHLQFLMFPALFA
jgi:hypothetical protein